MMKVRYPNTQNSERTVELEFYKEIMSNIKQQSFLDVGGIPSTPGTLDSILSIASANKVDYQIADFRGGKYRGDFVTLDFKGDTFDNIMFLSSLEHFPYCTEGDRVFRKDEDRKGFEKALSILKPNGKIYLTVPFGKDEWFNYHQSYDIDHLLKLTDGSKVESQYIYILNKENNYWEASLIGATKEISNPGPINSVGCFILKKNG